MVKRCKAVSFSRECNYADSAVVTHYKTKCVFFFFLSAADGLKETTREAHHRR